MKKGLILPLLGLIFASSINGLNNYSNIEKANAESAPQIMFGYSCDRNNLTRNKIHTYNIYGDYFDDVASFQFEISFPNNVNVQNLYFGYEITSKNSSLYDYYVEDNVIKGSIITNDSFNSYLTIFNFDFYILDDYLDDTLTFDFKIIEACDFDLNDIEFVVQDNVTFKVNNKTNEEVYNFTSSISSITTQYDEQFEITYSMPSYYSIVCGTIKIVYDFLVVELVDFNYNEYFDHFICDVNTSEKGAIYFSFAGNDINYDASNISFVASFKSVTNEYSSSKIITTLSDLSNYNLVDFLPINNVVTVTNLYTELIDKPNIYLNSVKGENNTLITSVCFDAGTHLGAGDFVINFDNEILEYVSYEKISSFSYFLVNVNHIEEGVIKFSIINFEDIVDELTAIKFVFNINYETNKTNTFISLTGNNLYDSSTTNELDINVKGEEIIIFDKAINSYLSQNLMDNELSININFDANSNIESGYFDINYDPRLFTYVDVMTNKDSLNINLNENDTTNGLLSFSFVTSSPLVDSTPIVQLNFLTKPKCDNKTSTISFDAKTFIDNSSNYILINDSSAQIEILGNGTHSWTIYEHDSGNIHKSLCDDCGMRLSGFCDYELIDEQVGTCLEEGSKTYECKLCHHSYTETTKGDHVLVAEEIKEEDTFITYNCKHCNYSEEHQLSLVHLSMKETYVVDYISFHKEIILYLTIGDTLKVEYDFNYFDLSVCCNGISYVSDYIYECYEEGAYRIFFNENYETYDIEEANETEELKYFRADKYKEKLKSHTHNMTICDQYGILGYLYDDMVELIEEYQNMSTELREIINSLECFDGYSCYDVIMIVNRGLIKAGWTNSQLLNNNNQYSFNYNDSTTIIFVVSICGLCLTCVFFIIKKKKLLK